MTEKSLQENFALSALHKILSHDPEYLNACIAKICQSHTDDKLGNCLKQFKITVGTKSYLEDVRPANQTCLASALMTALMQTVYAHPEHAYKDVMLAKPNLFAVFFAHGANPNGMSGGIPFFIEVMRDVDEKNLTTGNLICGVFVENGLDIPAVNTFAPMVPELIVIIQDGIQDCHQKGKVSPQQQFDVFKALVEKMKTIARTHAADYHPVLVMFSQTHLSEAIKNDNQKLQEIVEVIPSALNAHLKALQAECKRLPSGRRFLSSNTAASPGMQEFEKFLKENPILIILVDPQFRKVSALQK